MRIGRAQINCQIAAFDQNFDKILNYIEKAKERRCDLVVFPELALFGYWPSDLLERKDLVTTQLKKLAELTKKIPDNISALVGAVTLSDKKSVKHYHNSLVL